MHNDILVVDDDASSIQLMASILADLGTLRFATCGTDAMRLAREQAPDLMLLDAEMPGMSGFDVLGAMKLDAGLANVPVILVTSHCEAAFEVAGLEKGAVDFIGKPVNAALVRARAKTQLHIKRLADELRHRSATDALTGVANRRRFDDSLDHEWRRARRYGDPLSLLMIDVDHFKPFNDRYGHPAGDACLRAVAQSLVCATARPADLVARYGGEEFTVLLPLTRRCGAEHVARGVLDAIESLGIVHETSSTSRHVTVSVGVACYDDESACWMSPSADARFANELRLKYAPTDLIRAADAALYSAKHAGRAQARFLDIADLRPRPDAHEVLPSGRVMRAAAMM